MKKSGVKTAEKLPESAQLSAKVPWAPAPTTGKPASAPKKGRKG